jgi:secreted trypsin-like serine protease
MTLFLTQNAFSSLQSDSGGPLYMTHVSVNGKESDTLLGVAALVPSHLECAKGSTLVCFTSVPEVDDWIKNHTQEDDPDDSTEPNGETGGGASASANAIVVALLAVSIAFVLI